MSFRQIVAKKNYYTKKLLNIQPKLNNESGIYIFTRFENGFKYAYIGQAKHLIDRLVSHLMGYESYIDKSLIKHKLFSEDNETGWKVDFFNCKEDDLNKKEVEYIRLFADNGYQLRNKTSGSQSVGKFGIADNKESKGYRQGLKNGYINCKKDIMKLCSRLEFKPKDSGKISARYYEKFKEFLENEIEND